MRPGIFGEFFSVLGLQGWTLNVFTSSYLPPKDQAEDQGSLGESSPRALSGAISEMELNSFAWFLVNLPLEKKEFILDGEIKG